MATIRDYGGTTDPLGSPPLGGPGGWCEAVADKFDEVRADGWVTAARLAANSVTAAKIAANAVGASELADGSVTPSKLQRPIGNLLTDNQANPYALGGFTVVNGTETAPGVYVANGSGAFSVYTSVPAGGGQTYTARSYLSVTGAHSMVMVLAFQNAARETIGTPTLAAEVAPGSALRPQITAVAPGGTAFLQFTSAITALGASGAVGDSVTCSFSGVWLGAGGVWQMPGRPITNLGLRADPANSAQVQIWNNVTATWITV